MHKPVEVKALSGYKLWVKFSDGVEGEVDLSRLAGKGIFTLGDDHDAFRKVNIGENGEIVWNRKIDLCPDAIYMEITGKSPEKLLNHCTKKRVMPEISRF